MKNLAFGVYKNQGNLCFISVFRIMTGRLIRLTTSCYHFYKVLLHYIVYHSSTYSWKWLVLAYLKGIVSKFPHSSTERSQLIILSFLFAFKNTLLVARMKFPKDVLLVIEISRNMKMAVINNS